MKIPLFVPESVPAFHVLELFRKNRVHLALVIDEHGSIQGTITLTDVLESIVGDVPADDSEEDEHRIVRRSLRTWLVDGLLPVDEFLGTFELEPDDFFGRKRCPLRDNGRLHDDPPRRGSLSRRPATVAQHQFPSHQNERTEGRTHSCRVQCRNGRFYKPKTGRHMIADGTQAPDFTLPDQEGGMIALSSFRGRKVLIVFIRGMTLRYAPRSSATTETM